MQREDPERESLTDLYRDKEKKRKRFTLQAQDETLEDITYNDDNNLRNSLSNEKREKFIKYGIIGGVVLILIILIIVLSISLSGKKPEPHVDPVTPSGPPVLPNSTNPYFISAQSIVKSSYSLSGQVIVKTPITQLSDILLGNETYVPKVGLDWNSTIKFGKNNMQSDVLNFTFDMVDFKVARLTLTDGKNTRFSIPKELVNKPESNKNMRLDMVGHQFNQQDASSPFSFSFSDVADRSNVFIDTKGQNLVFSDKYIQMDFTLPSKRQYGFGERNHAFRLKEGAWGMWASGKNTGERDTGRGRGGLAGVHPFLLVQTRKTQEYIGLFFRNSNAQTPFIRFSDDTKSDSTTLSYITLGGQLEVYFFIHGTAREVIQDYQKLFGKPNLPPFWALGWQEASFQGDNQDSIQNSIKSYKDLKLPLETLYFDIGMYNRSQNFAFNSTALPDSKGLQALITSQNQRLVAYVDSSIYAPESVVPGESMNPIYIEGNKQQVFIKSGIRSAGSFEFSGNLVGKKSTGQKCVYIDWFNLTSAPLYWRQIVQGYVTKYGFDGLWTTENEPFSLIQGEYLGIFTQAQLQNAQTTNDTQQYYDNKWYTVNNVSGDESTYLLPFIPEFNEQGPYDNFSLSLNGTHSGGLTEYNAHSLYGHAMMMTTFYSMQSQNDFRQFILTRSTFASTGRFASYAVRSRNRSWANLQSAIPHIMNMNMFGIPHSGVDVCGDFEANITASGIDEELCMRWYQLATFFPLARHSQDFSQNTSYLTAPQGFKNPTKQAQVKASMHDRMQYLRLMYTCLFEASEFGGSCIEPLYFHYTLDLASMTEETGTNDTFIFGGAVKVSPIVTPQGDNKTFKSHFPAGKWLNLADMSDNTIAKTDGYQDLKTSLNTVNVHLRPGSIIPYQDNQNQDLFTTADLLKQPISLIINRNERNTSTGTVFLDGGISRKEISDKTYEYYSITHRASKSIQFTLQQGTRGSQDAKHTLSKIVIGGAEDLLLNNFACAFLQDGSIVNLATSFDMKTMTRTFFFADKFDQPMKFSMISNIFYGNSESKDLNVCEVSTYEYYIPADFDLASVLATNQGYVPLLHKAGVLPQLNMTLRIFDDGIINVKWTWQDFLASNKRQHFEVPDEIVNTTRSAKQGDALGRHLIIQRNPFQINFTQQVGQTEPFLQIQNLIYDSYLNWIGIKAFTMKGDDFRGVMGLGERSQDQLFLKDGIYSMWSVDMGTRPEDGKSPGKQSYGVHPFFMYQHQPDHWVGVFFKQAQAHDWLINNQPQDGVVNLRQIATGGYGDIYVMFKGQRPDSVVGLYQNIIGKPALMPQWSLGWHQCKYCYRNLDDYRQVVENYHLYQIPLDGQWADIDYMQDYRDFTVDPINFGNITRYVDDLYHNQSVKFVPIIDPGISLRSGSDYSTYNLGLQKNVFLKMAGQIEPYTGQVWPNEAVFPDFFHPNTSSWWANELTQFQEKLIWFDGLWLDMNEAANFCNGPCHERQKAISSEIDQLIYMPTGRDLQTKALPIDIKHYNGFAQLDAHSYYGSQQTKATYDWFLTRGYKRPFIVERSSFAGLGKYAGKWLGDTFSTAQDMQRSVTGSMMMNVFGIPFVGGDICGFQGPNSSPELCARWHQVGAFQTFSRNHRDCEGKPQEPYRFSNVLVGDQNVTDIMRDAILTKYSLLRYYYTHLFLLSTDVATVGTFYKPLFFEFPNEAGAYSANPSENVMLGPSLKLSIKTSLNTNWTSDMNSYYFPQGVWADIMNPESVDVTSKAGVNQSLPSALKDFQVHLRDGHIIPMQDAWLIRPKTTQDLDIVPVDIHIHPKNVTTGTAILFQASGQYVNDPGNSMDIRGAVNQYSISFSYRNASGTEQIKMTVALKQNATRFYKNETKCSTINATDLLGDIYIYDSLGMFQDIYYVVELLRPDMTIQVIGIAKYDTLTDRLIMTGSDAVSNVCLSYIQEIRFNNRDQTAFSLQ